MKTTITRSAWILFFTAWILLLSGCTTSEQPLTEAEQAEQHGMTLEEYRAQKEAAASMGMSVNDHLNMNH